MRCLITGGAGFIGSNLVDKLIEKGHAVIVLDNESAIENEKFYWNEKAENYKYDICDYDLIASLFIDIDVVFHLAAESRIQVAMQNPQRTINVNCLGTHNIMLAAKNAKVKKVIYSSTSAYYGLKNTPPNKENMERDCLNPYSVTKVAGEDIVLMYHKLYGIDVMIFRYFNVYGERQPTKGQYAPVVGLFQKMKNKGLKMTVVGDGLSRRDYTHVSDVVQANILAANQLFNCNGEIINIGTGVNHSVLDLVHMIGGGYEHINERKGEAKETLADISKARKILGWSPKIRLQDWIENNK